MFLLFYQICCYVIYHVMSLQCVIEVLIYFAIPHRTLLSGRHDCISVNNSREFRLLLLRISEKSCRPTCICQQHCMWAGVSCLTLRV